MSVAMQAGALRAYAATTYDIDWILQPHGAYDDLSFDVAVDDLGGGYFAGQTVPWLSNENKGDSFLTRFDSAGSVVWSRQMGTVASDIAYSVAVDASLNAYVTGYTEGNFAATNAGTQDAFLRKYDSAGNVLWSRQLGTVVLDYSYAVDTDPFGDVYISGTTAGDLGRTEPGSRDAFLAKYDTLGNLLWTRQLGTRRFDESYALATDSSGNAFISGRTGGNLAGTAAGLDDVFLAKYDGAGNLAWSRQYGSASSESADAAAVDGLGNVYITGHTLGDLFGTPIGDYDVFLAKFDTNGTLLWNRKFGTPSADWPHGLVADAQGNVFVSGRTGGDLAAQSVGNDDAFVLKFDPTGENVWSYQLGSTSWDYRAAVDLDSHGNLFLTGYTGGILGEIGNRSGWDAFVVKFTPNVIIGDMNGDATVDLLDIQPFELALCEPAIYLLNYPALTDYKSCGDMNGDGFFDNFDIAPLEALLFPSNPIAGVPAHVTRREMMLDITGAAVPEPSSDMMLAIGLVVLAVGSLGARPVQKARGVHKCCNHASQSRVRRRWIGH